MRWAEIVVDHAAIAANVDHLRALVAPAELWAVVKADAYGHGAVEVARTALAAGATGLCVALTQEAVELRAAGVEAPVLLLSQQPAEHAATIAELGVSATVYRTEAIAALAAAAGADSPIDVHLKIDTGMQRVGASPSDAAELAALIAATAGVRLAGVFTHLAVADDPADPASEEQLAVFDRALAAIEEAGVALDGVMIHAANSAGALAHPAARRSLVRAGIAVYGIEPGDGVADLCGSLQPALRLAARVSHVKRVAAGSRISYGLRHRFEHDTTVATVPIGYADGVPRRLGASGRGAVPAADTGAVLIGGRRRPIVGVVTMDQLLVDCGDDSVQVGDEVVLIGQQGDASIRAEEWAELVGTIGYEIVCGLGSRVPRRHRRSLESDDSADL